eukprot:TCONS_00051036-protein
MAENNLIMKKLWERNESMFHNIRFYHAHTQAVDMIGKPYLMTDTPLKYTGDDQRIFHLLDETVTPLPNSTTLTQLGDGVLQSTEPIYSTSQCSEMLTRLENLDNELGLVCNKTYRKTAIIHDKPFVDMLWCSLEANFNAHRKETKMLGFDTLRGNWMPCGLHHGLTLHRHNDYWRFNLHANRPQIDGQFCPDTDHRSLYTCLIFLNSDFEEGEIEFFIPNVYFNSIERRNKTNKQLIAAYESANCLQTFTYKPKAGDVLLIRQDTIYHHLNLSRGTEDQKWFLKCDLMFDRTGDEKFQWSIPAEEKMSHDSCVSSFRGNQYEEFTDQIRSCLAAGKEVSDEYASDIPDERYLYDRMESILNTKYTYPVISQPEAKTNSETMISDSENQVDQPLIEKCKVFLPDHVWLRIFEHLPASDCRHLTKAFPELVTIYKMMLKRAVFVPELCHHNGVSTEFTFKNSTKIEKDLPKAALLSTIYSLILLGNVDRDLHYLILFHPELKTAEEIALEEILHCVFTYSPLPDGDVFLVRQQDADERKPLRDLFHSVDRRFMSANYAMEYFGIDVHSERKCCFEITKEYDDVDLSQYEDQSRTRQQLLYKDCERDLQVKGVQRMFTRWDNCFLLFKNEKDRNGESVERKHYEFSMGLAPKETLLAIQRQQVLSKSHHEEDADFLAFPFEFVERQRGMAKNCPSALVVRKLEKSVQIERRDYCVCFPGDEEISWKLSNNCSTYVFNRFILRNGLLEKYEIEEDDSWPDPDSESSDSERSDDDSENEEDNNPIKKNSSFDGFSHCQY